MSYAVGHATSSLCASADGRRAAGSDSGPALLRSSDAFVLRRCQILLASARGERAPRIAAPLGCDDQTVLAALHAFNAQGLAALQNGSSHRRPREFGHPTSLWTLDLAAEVSCAEGLTPTVVSGEAVRKTLLQLGIGWKRAQQWITSPDPAYVRKQGSATA